MFLFYDDKFFLSIYLPAEIALKIDSTRGGEDVIIHPITTPNGPAITKTMMLM